MFTVTPRLVSLNSGYRRIAWAHEPAGNLLSPEASATRTCSGVALVGFSYWHLTLYQQNARMRGHSA